MSNRCMIIGAWIAVAATAGPAHAQNRMTATDSVRRLDSLWARSYATHDTASALALFDPAIVIVGGRGEIKTRDRELGDVRPSAGLVMQFFRTTDVDVRMHPGAASVTGIAEWAFTWQGRPQQAKRRYTATYTRGGPLGWTMITLHIGPPAAAAPPPNNEE